MRSAPIATLAFTVVAVLLSPPAFATTFPDDYLCPLCLDSASLALHSHSTLVDLNARALRKACKSDLMPLEKQHGCDFLHEYAKRELTTLGDIQGGSTRAFCEHLGACEPESLALWGPPSPPSPPVSPIDLRITKGFGPRGYKSARVSLIGDSSAFEEEQRAGSVKLQVGSATPTDFQYKAAFQHRWTDRSIYSSVVQLEEGENALVVSPKRSESKP